MPLKAQEIAAKIKEEHQHIKQEIANVSRVVNKDVAADEFPRWRLDLLWLLRDFQNDMQKHFDLEEEGGFMSDVLQVAPQNMNAVKKLEEEHEQILNDLQQILADLKALSEKDDAKLELIRKNINDLFALLHHHEETEGELIVNTYLQDEGSVD